MRERELKVVVPADHVLRPERLELPGAFLSAFESHRITDVYFDTADLRLARWGVTLRHRRDGSWTVKVPRSSRKGTALDRDEIDLAGPEPSSPTDVPREAAALVLPFARSAALGEVATVRTLRHARTWRRIDGSVVGQLTDDHVVGVSAGTGAGRAEFREIEFELGPEAAETLLQDVAEGLSLPEDRAMPKLVRVLGPRVLAPPDVVVNELGAEPTAAEVVHRAIAASVQQILSNLPSARVGASPEGVHQARVATRRLRSDLRTFGPLLDKAWARRLRAELSWIASELGAVRDADVLGAVFADAVKTETAFDTEAAQELHALLARQRDAHRSRLLGHLADRRAVELYDGLVAAAAEPALKPRAFKQQAVAAMPGLVRRAWQELDDTVNGLPADPAEDQLHRIRILAKRARYAAESTVPAVGRPARRFAKATGALQEILGDLHDGAVAAAWLTAAVDDGLSPRAAFTAGQLAEHFRRRADPEHIPWLPAWERVRDRSDWIPRS